MWIAPEAYPSSKFPPLDQSAEATPTITPTETQPPTATVELLAGFKEQLPGSFPNLTIDSTDLLDINGYDGARILVTNSMTGVKVRQAMFLVKVKNTIWMVTYSSSIDGFANQLLMIEKSIQTFTLVE